MVYSCYAKTPGDDAKISQADVWFPGRLSKSLKATNTVKELALALKSLVP